jgi:7,8-dihydropterin-6-yl-methyl-4-(beta-D-ribofuranosyl)aminobenzene 5'-phosphate synthase
MNDTMKKPPGSPLAVDRVEVLTLMDNYVDLLLEDTDRVLRPARAEGGEIPTDTLLAEHGLSLLVTVYSGEKRHTILFDTGYSPVGVPHNMEMLGVDPEEIETVVMSHAHMDHTGALYPILERIPQEIPLVVHPHAFVFPRYLQREDGVKRRFPRTLIRENLTDAGVAVVESRGPARIAEGMVLVTGEVERTTPFEKGMPNAVMEKDGRLEPDPINDDQALVMLLEGKGLVVISGCSHSGIVNTLLYARKVMGVEEIYAVMGGFHLSGPLFEPIIDATIAAVKEMGPRVIVPMHCTGWKATRRFHDAFAAAFELNSVGSKVTLGFRRRAQG